MNLVQMMKRAIELDEERTTAHFEEQQKRRDAGLPSWDVFLTRNQWEASYKEGLKKGLIIKKEDHYVLVGRPMVAPDARILISGKIGEPAINPIALSKPKDDNQMEGGEGK